MVNLIQILFHYVLPFFVVISIVVFVHEYGHYWVARRCGVRVLTFSIGFGQEVFGWNDRHGTRWKICWVPLGGFVQMFGDSDPASSPAPAVHTMTEAEKKVAFYHQTVGRRAAIVSAGPISNYIFAILALALLFIFKGQPYTPADVHAVDDNSPAASAGIRPGDHIAAIDGVAIERFEQVKRIVALNEGTSLAVDIDRAGERLHFTLTPVFIPNDKHVEGDEKARRLGISSDKLQYRKRTPIQALGLAAVESWDMTFLSLKVIGQMITGSRGSGSIGGPLRIAEMSSKVVEDGVASLVRFLAIISISLGFINLFPVPLLDGGHLAFCVVEKLKGSPLSPHAQEVGVRIGVVLVVSLMVFATWNDLVHLKVVSYIRNLFS